MPYAVFPRTPGRDYAGVVIDGPAELDRPRGVRLLRRSRHPPRWHPCDASRGGEPMPWWKSRRAFRGRRPPASAFPSSPRWRAFAAPDMPKTGETVLVMGVNGKVGQAAVQIATWHGARVIGVVRKDEPYEGHANSPVEVIDASATDVADARARAHGRQGRRHRLQHRRRSLFPGRAQVAGAARPPDPDRRGRPHRAVQHPGILSRPAHLCRHRHARAVVDRDRRGARGNSVPVLPAGT